MASSIETNVQRAAAAFFAVAVGYAVYRLLGLTFGQSGYAIGAGLGAYFLCALALRVTAGPTTRLKIPVFDLRDFEPFELGELLLTDKVDELVLTEADRICDELLLTDADRLGTLESEPLVLDDVLTAVSADSRVVRLFDRKAMPTPGQLRSTIDRHLEGNVGPNGDAAKALSDALAELKRSLR